MKKLVEKLIEGEMSMSQKKGTFHLFALFLREDSPDKWDLVVAAPWIDKDKEAALKYIAQNIQKSLEKDELLKISRIVMIDEGNPALSALQRAFRTEHSLTEIKNSNFFGLQIKHAFIITSKRNGDPKPNTEQVKNA
jgi:hypothetical protein